MLNTSRGFRTYLFTQHKEHKGVCSSSHFPTLTCIYWLDWIVQFYSYPHPTHIKLPEMQTHEANGSWTTQIYISKTSTYISLADMTAATLLHKLLIFFLINYPLLQWIFVWKLRQIESLHFLHPLIFYISETFPKMSIWLESLNQVKLLSEDNISSRTRSKILLDLETRFNIVSN